MTSLPLQLVPMSRQETLQINRLVKSAKSIVVAGSGPTGVETIGELAHAYSGNQELTFFLSGPRSLEGLPVTVQVRGEGALQEEG